MKHIKTYKLFENNSQLSPEEICENITEEILTPLKGIYLDISAWPIYEVDETYLKIVIQDDEKRGIDFSVEEFSDNFKQLFSQLDEWGWVPMGKNDKLITTTPAKQKVSNLASHVEITDYEYICPSNRLENGEWIPCESDETSEIDSDNEKCDKCGYVAHPDYFITSNKKFGTLKELLFLIRRSLDKIQICFIRE